MLMFLSVAKGLELGSKDHPARDREPCIFLIALVFAVFLIGCSNSPTGNLQVQVQIPGSASGSVAYTAQVVDATSPAVSGAYTCVNVKPSNCYGAQTNLGQASLTTALAPGGDNITVSSYIEFSQLQPGTWDVNAKINGSQVTAADVCGIPVAANNTTTLTISDGPNPSTYQVGNGATQTAQTCTL
jgi:hypothetical protein